LFTNFKRDHALAWKANDETDEADVVTCDDVGNGQHNQMMSFAGFIVDLTIGRPKEYDWFNLNTDPFDP
jgi:hypothetical protein